jgi:hypothetical protein
MTLPFPAENERVPFMVRLPSSYTFEPLKGFGNVKLLKIFLSIVDGTALVLPVKETL